MITKLPNSDIREIGNFTPVLMRQIPYFIEYHFSIHHFAEKMDAIFCTNGDEVDAILDIVVAGG